MHKSFAQLARATHVLAAQANPMVAGQAAMRLAKSAAWAEQTNDRWNDAFEQGISVDESDAEPSPFLRAALDKAALDQLHVPDTTPPARELELASNEPVSVPIALGRGAPPPFGPPAPAASPPT